MDSKMKKCAHCKKRKPDTIFMAGEHVCAECRVKGVNESGGQGLYVTVGLQERLPQLISSTAKIRQKHPEPPHQKRLF